MTIGDEDLISTGWLRAFPGPALAVFGAVWLLANAEDGSITGDLDDLGPRAFGVDRYGGFDVVYDPAGDDEALDDPTWSERWEEWRPYAAERGLPMKTMRDLIVFMADVGVLRRIEDHGDVTWQPAQQLPLTEDVLRLSAERRAEESRLRWADRFRGAESYITHWLIEQRDGDQTTTTVTVSLAQLGSALDLDVDDARHGLINASAGGSDIAVAPDPETAAPNEPLTFTVDWDQFARDRIAIRFSR